MSNTSACLTTPSMPGTCSPNAPTCALPGDAAIRNERFSVSIGRINIPPMLAARADNFGDKNTMKGDFTLSGNLWRKHACAQERAGAAFHAQRERLQKSTGKGSRRSFPHVRADDAYSMARFLRDDGQSLTKFVLMSTSSEEHRRHLLDVPCALRYCIEWSSRY